jgi:hypothetical protein
MAVLRTSNPALGLQPNVHQIPPVIALRIRKRPRRRESSESTTLKSLLFHFEIMNAIVDHYNILYNIHELVRHCASTKFQNILNAFWSPRDFLISQINWE